LQSERINLSFSHHRLAQHNCFFYVENFYKQNDTRKRTFRTTSSANQLDEGGGIATGIKLFIQGVEVSQTRRRQRRQTPVNITFNNYFLH
jgi:hypothetical protein